MPHTVIKSWISLGRNLDETLTNISNIVAQSTNDANIHYIKEGQREIEKRLPSI